jgi:hypothetical protein
LTLLPGGDAPTQSTADAEVAGGLTAAAPAKTLMLVYFTYSPLIISRSLNRRNW